MAIKNKSKDPKSTDFSKKELVINIKEGKLFYKSDKGLHEPVATNEKNITPEFTSSGIAINNTHGDFPHKIFKTNKNYIIIPKLVISGSGIGMSTVGGSFRVGKALEVHDGLELRGDMNLSGSIIPTAFGSFDLGSSDFPFRDLHVLTSSIRFYDSQGEVGKIQFTRDEGMQIKQVNNNIISSGSFDIDGGSF